MAGQTPTHTGTAKRRPPSIDAAIVLALSACQSAPPPEIDRVTWQCSIPLDRSLGWGASEMVVDEEGRLLGRRIHWSPTTPPGSAVGVELHFGDPAAWDPPVLRKVRVSASTSRPLAADADLLVELSDGSRAQAEFYRPRPRRGAAAVPIGVSNGADFADPAFLELLAKAEWIRASIVEPGTGRVADTAVIDLARQGEARGRIARDWTEVERRARNFRSRCIPSGDFDAIL
jgi:hypothetical protein